MQKDKRSGSLVGQEVLTNTTLLPRAGHEDKLNMAQKLGAELSRFCSLIVLDFWQNGFFAVAVEEVPENTDVEKQNEFNSVKSQFLGGFFSAGLRSCCGSFWKLPREEDCQRSVSRWIILHVKPDRHKHCFLSERLIFTLRIDRLGENKLPACKSIPENIGWSLRKLRERNKILFGALTCIYVHVQPLGCIYTFRILKGQFLLTCGDIYV